MKINNSSGQIGTIIFFLFLIFFCVFIGKFTVLQSPVLVLGLVGGLIISLITLVNTDLALIILIFSMLLSPEIPIAHTPERAVVIRIDDILVVFMFFTWLAKMAINKQLGFFKKTPINLPISLYAFILILSTLKGIITGTIIPVVAIFYLLKYIEYIMIFFMVINNIKNLKQIKIFVFFLLLVYLIISIYAIWQVRVFGVSEIRVSAPFEGEKPEPNTLAGYLLFLIGINLGLLLYSNSIKRRLFLIGIFSLSIISFLWTLSRSAWLGFIATYLALLLLSKKMRLPLFLLLVISILFLPQILPKEIMNRIIYTFQPGKELKILGSSYIFDYSSVSRIDAWGYLTSQCFPKYPLLGKGVTGVGLMDGQYFRVLGEVGLIGLLIFVWLIFSIFKVAFRNFRTIDDNWIKGLSIGFLSGLTGLTIQAIFANVFIIVRIMEPLMFMTAIMVACYDLAPIVSPLIDSDKHVFQST